MRDRHPLSTTAKAIATIVVVAGLLFATGILLSAKHDAGLAADVKTREVAANAVPNLGVSLRAALTAAETSSSSRTKQVDFDRSEDAGIPVELAVRARDTGGALLSDNGLVVAATYSTDTVPKSVAERRAAVDGLHVVPLQLDPAVERLRPAAGGISVTSPSDTLGEAGGKAPEGASTYQVPLAISLVSGWTVNVWTPPQRIGLVAWLLAGLCLLAGIGGAAFVVRRARAVAETEDRLARLQLQTDVVAGIAGVAQRSLDLADVLPAVSTQLSDALGLRGLSLTIPTPSGERAFFRHGDAAHAEVPLTLPDRLPAGASTALVLARGSRTVARLHVTAGRDLSHHDLTTLESAGEILTSALANAEAFAQQREALQRLRAVDELKTVFLATASHELRTPVGVISGFAELLATHVDNLDSSKIRSYATRIDATAQQLASLVENLLDFSRMERGVHSDQGGVELDLGATVRRVLDEHMDLGDHHELVTTTPPGFVVRGTDHAIERVLTNLVGNAAKYSPAGTTIRVHLRQEGDKVALHVDDEGAGVAPADREQVFSRFYRGKGDAVVNTRGAGLGLAIVHEFAASMGGVASVTEAPSGGARFTVRFPLAGTPDVPAQSGATDDSPVEGATDVLT